MSEVPKLERSNKRNQGPRNDQFLFILYLKNEFVKLTEGYPPTTGRGGYRSVSLKKLFFLIQYKRNLSIRGPLFFLLERSSLGTSDIQGCYSPKAITYIYIYNICPYT